MNTMKLSSKVLMGVALLMFVRNVGASWTELHEWHGVASTLDPAFVAKIIGDLLPTLTAFAAGLSSDLPAALQPTYTGPDRRGEVTTATGAAGASVSLGPVAIAPAEAPK